MQIEQTEVATAPRRTRSSLTLEALPSLSSLPSPSDDSPALSRLHMSCWSLLAFSHSVSETSDSIARMAATKSEELWWPIGLDVGGQMKRMIVYLIAPLPF
ncbi:hypothetical protein TorRG33x02_261620 [Trema orientale]|uniref:Uncharacterized protein n=1 Tax=Trema orientale TaxID=63057 RepID=A0A2P5D5V8_TREOI|nr:hypothetical protein TorRG33x02_261620 [Trema orientale]